MGCTGIHAEHQILIFLYIDTRPTVSGAVNLRYEFDELAGCIPWQPHDSRPTKISRTFGFVQCMREGSCRSLSLCLQSFGDERSLRLLKFRRHFFHLAHGAQVISSRNFEYVVVGVSAPQKFRKQIRIARDIL